jgi:predicted alpha/beta superfamily hydrolase
MMAHLSRPETARKPHKARGLFGLTLLALLLLVLAATIPSAARAKEADSRPPAEVSIPNSRQIELVSKVNGQRYTISIALPFANMPGKGYGVVYLFDSYISFAAVAEAARAAAEAAPVVVVGIGYPQDKAWTDATLKRKRPLPSTYDGVPDWRVAPSYRRLYDLSLPVAAGPDLDALNAMGLPPLFEGDTGGIDDLLKIIEREVKPLVRRLVKTDPDKEILFGHSLGGMAVVHALFVAPEAYNVFIASSPSIWWNNKQVLRDEAAFTRAVRAGTAHPRILITVGSKEAGPDRGSPGWSLEVQAAWDSVGMVSNAQALAERLRALPGKPGYDVEYKRFDQVGHRLAIWAALARGIDFAFGLE